MQSTRPSWQIIIKLHCPDRYSRNPQISNFVKFRPAGAELFHADGQTDERRDMMKVKVAFRNFANAPKASAFDTTNRRQYTGPPNQFLTSQKIGNYKYIQKL